MPVSPKVTENSAICEPNHRRFRPGCAPEAFAREFARQVRGRGESYELFIGKFPTRGQRHTKNLLRLWAEGKLLPRWPSSFRLLNRIEKRFGLPKNHFRKILFPKSATKCALDTVLNNQYRHGRWHLPDDFDSRSKAEQHRILTWVRENILSCSTDYGKFMKEITSVTYSLRLPAILDLPGQPSGAGESGLESPRVDAPKQLVQELTDLVAFKRSAIAPPGFRRFSGWTKFSAFKQVRWIGRMFGGLVASADSVTKGFGAPVGALTIALFVFPAFWDWYLGWCESRRGFFTALEASYLHTAVSLVRRYTGWLRQHPELAEHLAPIPGMISARDIAMAQKDWQATCDRAIEHLRDRIRELRRINRPHRDPFHPIMVVLKSQEPLNAYKKIADEVLKQWPAKGGTPLAVAEASRAYLMLRLTLHLVLRNRNLRELLFSPKGATPRSDAYLEANRRGELRWSSRSKTWEVRIPAIAFKNWDSTFFRHGPFHVVLPDVENLYRHIETYLRRHRAVLLNGYDAPQSFFVRTLRSSLVSGEYNGSGFLRQWNDIIKKYGIYNPYTGRGAIEGLLPHGPSAVRDVVATHMLKQNASYELASFALQDVPTTIKAHYCRLITEEKSALAAPLLNRAWTQPVKIS